jgi:hypothetical protein
MINMMKVSIIRVAIILCVAFLCLVSQAQQNSEGEAEINNLIRIAERQYRIKEPIEVKKTENGITCKQVRITDMSNNVSGNEMFFGQRIKIHFDQMKGFNAEGRYAYPSIAAVWKDEQGNVLKKYNNIGDTEKYYYNEKEGIDKFGVYFKLAKPLFSGKIYIFSVEVTDRKGEGRFNFEFKVKPLKNKTIKFENYGLACEELAICYYDKYEKRTTFIEGSQLNSYETNYLYFIDLTGFSKNDEGNTDLSIKVDMIDESSGEVQKNISNTEHYTTDRTDPVELRVELDYLPIVNCRSSYGRVTVSDNLSSKKIIAYIDFFN